MVLIHEQEKHKYDIQNQNTTTGNGIADIFKVASKVKDIIIPIGQLASTAGKIAEASKTANRLKELEEARKIQASQVHQQHQQGGNLSESTRNKVRNIGKGFEEF